MTVRRCDKVPESLALHSLIKKVFFRLLISSFGAPLAEDELCKTIHFLCKNHPRGGRNKAEHFHYLSSSIYDKLKVKGLSETFHNISISPYGLICYYIMLRYK